jgi:hypothetical protein
MRRWAVGGQVRRPPCGMAFEWCPARAGVGPDRQWPELIKGEHPIGKAHGDVLDSGQLRGPGRVG